MPTVSVALTIIAYDPTVACCRQLPRGQHKTCLHHPSHGVLGLDGLSTPIWGVGPSVLQSTTVSPSIPSKSSRLRVTKTASNAQGDRRDAKVHSAPSWPRLAQLIVGAGGRFRKRQDRQSAQKPKRIAHSLVHGDEFRGGPGSPQQRVARNRWSSVTGAETAGRRAMPAHRFSSSSMSRSDRTASIRTGIFIVSSPQLAPP